MKILGETSSHNLRMHWLNLRLSLTVSCTIFVHFLGFGGVTRAGDPQWYPDVASKSQWANPTELRDVVTRHFFVIFDLLFPLGNLFRDTPAIVSSENPKPGDGPDQKASERERERDRLLPLEGKLGDKSLPQEVANLNTLVVARTCLKCKIVSLSRERFLVLHTEI